MCPEGQFLVISLDLWENNSTHAPFKQWEFIDHVGSAQKQKVLTQICNAEEHLPLEYYTAYCALYDLKMTNCVHCQI